MTGSTNQLAVAPLAPEVDAGLFRETLGRFATGVALITAGAQGAPLGLIANSLASVSLSPPLLSFCPSRDSFTWSRMRRARRFGVNLLGAQHEDYVRRAAPANADRFAGIDWELTPSGVPRLGDALAFLDCAIAAEHPAGDHRIVVGRIEHAQFDPGGEPLVFWASRFGRYSEDRRTDAPQHVEGGSLEYPARPKRSRAGSYVAPSNADLIRPIYEEWSRGNWRPSFDVYGPQMEWGWSDEFPGLAGVYGDRRDPNPRLRSWLREWETWRVEPDEYLELGDHVVVLATYHGRGKGSGVEVHQQGAHVFELRDGKVVRLEIFASRDKAIESVRRDRDRG